MWNSTEPVEKEMSIIQKKYFMRKLERNLALCVLFDLFRSFFRFVEFVF